MLTPQEEMKIARKIARKLEYWKKHNPEKYKEMMRYIKMAEGKIV